MASGSTEGMSQGAKVVLTIVLISATIILFGIGFTMIQHGIKNAKTIDQKVSGFSLSQYDNSKVSGSDVIGAIQSMASDDMVITVETNANTAGITYKKPLYNISTKSDVNYIELTGSFSATLDKNSNGTVTGITFVQQ